MPPRRRSRAARLDAVAARLTVSQRLTALLADPESPAVHHSIRQGLTPAERATLRSACDRVVYLRITSHEYLLQIQCAITIPGMGRPLAHAPSGRPRRRPISWRQCSPASRRRRRSGGHSSDPELVADVRVIAERLRAMAISVDTAGDGDPPLLAMNAQLRDAILLTCTIWLRALAIEAAAFAAEFGADPLTPELHALADHQRVALTACIDDGSPWTRRSR